MSRKNFENSFTFKTKKSSIRSIQKLYWIQKNRVSVDYQNIRRNIRNHKCSINFEHLLIIPSKRRLSCFKKILCQLDIILSNFQKDVIFGKRKMLFVKPFRFIR